MFDPVLAFEEVLSRQLASLHAFALFLACDREDLAEDLLARAVSHAFEACLRGAEPAIALERGLVEEALTGRGKSTPPGQALPLRVTTLDRVRLRSVSPSCLRRAATRIPPDARAAIWLVVVDRRTYADAARLLGVDASTVESLLAWRDPLIRFALDDPASSGLRASGVKH
ncbi:MAG: RNA polymerase sigma factor [Longimicrobiales bacterium]